jgi:glucose/arabinose dehydrogenase
MTSGSASEDRNDCQTTHKRAKTCSSAAYVARVGGLAVALGIGTAVAGGQAIAHAETTGESTSPTSNDAPPSDPGQPDDGQLDGQPGATPSDKKNIQSPFWQRRIPAVLGISPSKGDDNIVSAGLIDPETASKLRRFTDPPGKRTKRANEVAKKADELTDISGASKPRRVTLPSDLPQIDIKRARVFTRPTISTMTDEVDPARTATVPTPPVGALSVDGNQPERDTVAAALRSGPGNTNRIVASLFGSTAVDSPATDPVAPVAPPSVVEVLTWAWRDFNRTFYKVANSAQTTQVEPLGRAQAALIEEPTTTSIFFEASPRTSEANGTVRVPIVRTGDLTRPSTIQYGITSDTATAGLDYVGESGTITIPAGKDRGYIPVQIINDDMSESTETFVVSIINVESGSTVLYPRTARIDILDDENPVAEPPSPPLTSNYNVTEQVVVSDLNQPIAFEFAPHEESLLYIAEKGGVIKVVDVDTGQQSTFIDISQNVNDEGDRGLMDIALHPDFGEEGAHNYVYAFYVVDPPDAEGKSGNAGPDGGGNRFAYLVRYTADPETNYTTVIEGSEVILLGGAADSLTDISGGGAVDSTSDFNQPESGFNAQTGKYVDNYIKVDSLSHAGGSLAFGPDGALYVSVGDGTSYNAADPRTVSVQNIDSLSGKILRIDPITGLGLPDNPFVKPGDDLRANHAKVYQSGLRNPFSIGFAEDGRLLISNTGWFSWEEIESGSAGANFGWPYFEGGDNGVLLPAPGYADLPSDPGRDALSAAEFYAAVANGTITITPAYRAFAHEENAPGYQLGAIVGVDAPYSYSGSQYPTEFQNDVFFTDVNTGRVYVVDVNNRSDVKYLYSTETAPVAFSQGPDGYVYVANLGGGTITRLLIEPSGDPIVDPNSYSEKQLELLSQNTGWIPVWSSLLSAINLISDLNDVLIALRDGDSANIADETGDLVGHVLGIGLGLLPGGTFVADFVGDGITELLSRPQV